jgi:hypothetical protein
VKKSLNLGRKQGGNNGKESIFNYRFFDGFTFSDRMALHTGHPDRIGSGSEAR